jgi:hypothetical protein
VHASSPMPAAGRLLSPTPAASSNSNKRGSGTVAARAYEPPASTDDRRALQGALRVATLLFVKPKGDIGGPFGAQRTEGRSARQRLSPRARNQRSKATRSDAFSFEVTVDGFHCGAIIEAGRLGSSVGRERTSRAGFQKLRIWPLMWPASTRCSTVDCSPAPRPRLSTFCCSESACGEIHGERPSGLCRRIRVALVRRRPLDAAAARGPAEPTRRDDEHRRWLTLTCGNVALPHVRLGLSQGSKKRWRRNHVWMTVLPLPASMELSGRGAPARPVNIRLRARYDGVRDQIASA